MTTRYPGGLIRKTPPTITPPVGGEGGSAPGVWTLEQASYYTKQGTWPKPPAPKYLYTVGLNSTGHLGDNTTINKSSPVQIGSDSTWSNVCISSTGSAAIKSNGTMWVWGNNAEGQLGQNDKIYRSSPVQLGALTTWSSVSIGYYSVLAIKTDGTLWAWGYNNAGQLGTNNGINRSSPVQVGVDTNWSYATRGVFASAGIRTDGTLWVWGQGQGGNAILGLNVDTGQAYSSPTQVGALTTWLNVSVGQYSMAAIKTDGAIWAWGRNSDGVLGDGTSIARSSPVQIGALTTWSLIKTTSYRHSMARRNDGTLWLWGSGNYGALGNNSVVSRSSPTQLGSDTNWSSEFSPLYAQASVAIKTDGTLWGWGSNAYGRLGQNDTVYRSSPVQVGSDSDWRKVSTGLASYSVGYFKSS